MQKHDEEGTVQGLYTHQHRLQVLHDIERKSWRFIAQNEAPYIGICHTTLSRIYRGIAPRDKGVCGKLNITRYALAPACVKCGKVHTTRDCVDARKPTRKPRWVGTLGHAGGEWRYDK
ncbi:MAG: hypothetical protein WC710_14095 [Gallionella sp.]|jgi:hypothetical protein